MWYYSAIFPKNPAIRSWRSGKTEVKNSWLAKAVFMNSLSCYRAVSKTPISGVSGAPIWPEKAGKIRFRSIRAVLLSISLLLVMNRSLNQGFYHVP